jgi:hypothetical protein
MWKVQGGFFCCQDHQKKAWPAHKPTCNLIYVAKRVKEMRQASARLFDEASKYVDLVHSFGAPDKMAPAALQKLIQQGHELITNLQNQTKLINELIAATKVIEIPEIVSKKVQEFETELGRVGVVLGQISSIVQNLKTFLN